MQIYDAVLLHMEGCFHKLNAALTADWCNTVTIKITPRDKSSSEFVLYLKAMILNKAK